MEGAEEFLDTSKAERAVWLMKCPALVSRSLQNPLHDSGRPNAKVILSFDPLANSDEPQFTMELAATESGYAPKCYTLVMSKDVVPLSVFSESAQGKAAVEGKIINKFDMRPDNENMEVYGKLCRERTKKYMVKSRQIRVIDNDNGIHMRPMPGLIIPGGTPEKKKASMRLSETKRTRRDRGEMEAILFKLFEKQSNWTLRQLILETDQPEQFLKDLLKDLCIYNNKGSTQGSYELKPEYKKVAAEPASEYLP